MRNGSHRFWLCIAAAVAVSVIAVPAASADFSSVKDPRRDTRCLHEGGFAPKPCSDSKRRNADIVRATASHDGALLKHTIRVVGKPKSVGLHINTDSDPDCEFRVTAVREGGVKYDGVRECVPHPPATGPARYEFHRHWVEISFSEESIGNPQSYGWHVSVGSLGRDYLHAYALDFVPGGLRHAIHGDRYIQHPLG